MSYIKKGLKHNLYKVIDIEYTEIGIHNKVELLDMKEYMKFHTSNSQGSMMYIMMRSLNINNKLISKANSIHYSNMLSMDMMNNNCCLKNSNLLYKLNKHMVDYSCKKHKVIHIECILYLSQDMVMNMSDYMCVLLSLKSNFIYKMYNKLLNHCIINMVIGKLNMMILL